MRPETRATVSPAGVERGGAPATREDMERAVLEVLRGLLAEVGDGRGLGRLSLAASLERDLGLGSLERVELVARLEEALGARLPEDVVGSADSAADLVAALLGRPAGAAARAPSPAPIPAHSAPAAPPDAPCAPAPERARTLVEVLEYRAARDPDRTHIVLVREDGAEEAITFKELRRDAGRVAAALRALDLRPGGTVAIMLPTSRGYFAAFMGALLAGGIPVPIYPPFRLDRIAEYIARQSKILANAHAQVLVTFDRAARVAAIARDRVPSLERVVSIESLLEGSGDAGAIAAAVGPDDTALIQYTSGSTGDPKGVELTHANVLANVRAAAAAAEIGPEDTVVSWLPLYHDMGLIAGWLLDLYTGMRAVLLSPMTFLARPETWLQTMSRHRATRSVAPNFAFDLCVKRVKDEMLAGVDLSSVRTILNGSEPIHPDTLERFAARFAAVGFRREALFPAYGLAENMVAVAFPPVLRAPKVDTIDRAPFEREGRAVPAPPGTKDALRFVACGRAVPGHEIRIVDERGEPLPERRQGRLHFRGPSAFKGYYRNPEATARVKLADGWVDSGDLAYFADGEVHITGRVKDVIIKGGRNYYPHEIEAAAATVPDVRQGCVAAFAVRDDARGTEAIWVLAETREQDASRHPDIARAVGEAVAGAVGVPPDRVVLAPPGTVPKTSSGKIRRGEARRIVLAGEVGKRQASFGRQAARLYLASLPARAAALGRRAARAIYGAYGLVAFGTLVNAGVAASFLTPSGRPLRRLSALVSRAALALLGVRARARGLENLPRGPAVLLVNHASYIDPAWLLDILPVDTRYVIKGECRDVSFFGHAMARAGHLLVERRAAERSLEGIAQMAGALRAGQQVAIFPEGTFFREVGLRPFKLGAFRVACECGVPVVPMVLRGTRRVLPDGTWLPTYARVELDILPPIRPDGRAIGDMIRLRDQAADAMAARLNEPRLGLVGTGEDPL